MGLFSKIAQGLKKTKESFSKKMYELFKGRTLDDEFYEELEFLLISADIGAVASEQIIKELKDECYKKRLAKAEDAKALLKSIMIAQIDYDIPQYEYPLIMLVAGVNGVGKTTAIGKLAKYFKTMGKSVLLAGADTFRAAAAEQLQVWADRADVRLVRQDEGADPAAVVFDALASAKARNIDVVLVDTAGRLHNKKNLMNELGKINKVVERECPNADYRTYIVIDATTGQNAVSQVETFNEIIDMDGIILNKLDGTAKGGVVFAISAEQELPVVFAGVGEQIDDLLPFNATSFINELFD